jgi:hypothetical protein
MLAADCGIFARSFLLSPKRHVGARMSPHNVPPRMAPCGQLATRLALSGKPR